MIDGVARLKATHERRPFLEHLRFQSFPEFPHEGGETAGERRPVHLDAFVCAHRFDTRLKEICPVFKVRVDRHAPDFECLTQGLNENLSSAFCSVEWMNLCHPVERL